MQSEKAANAGQRFQLYGGEGRGGGGNSKGV